MAYGGLGISPASVAYARNNRGSGLRLNGLMVLEKLFCTGFVIVLTTALERMVFDMLKKKYWLSCRTTLLGGLPIFTGGRRKYVYLRRGPG